MTVEKGPAQIGWFRRVFNHAFYGISDGREARTRMDELLAKPYSPEATSKELMSDNKELISYLNKNPRGELMVRISERIMTNSLAFTKRRIDEQL